MPLHALAPSVASIMECCIQAAPSRINRKLRHSPALLRYLDYFALWKIGAVPAPINTSLTSSPLKHCLAITHTKFIVTTKELLPIINPTLQSYASEDNRVQIVCYDYDTYQDVQDVQDERAFTF